MDQSQLLYIYSTLSACKCKSAGGQTSGISGIASWGRGEKIADAGLSDPGTSSRCVSQIQTRWICDRQYHQCVYIFHHCDIYSLYRLYQFYQSDNGPECGARKRSGHPESNWRSQVAACRT